MCLGPFLSPLPLPASEPSALAVALNPGEAGLSLWGAPGSQGKKILPTGVSASHLPTGVHALSYTATPLTVLPVLGTSHPPQVAAQCLCSSPSQLDTSPHTPSLSLRTLSPWPWSGARPMWWEDHLMGRVCAQESLVSRDPTQGISEGTKGAAPAPSPSLGQHQKEAGIMKLCRSSSCSTAAHTSTQNGPCVLTSALANRAG